MMGPRQVDQAALFYEFSLERHVPAAHLLRSIDRFVDLSDVRSHLAPFYSSTGRPSIFIPNCWSGCCWLAIATAFVPNVGCARRFTWTFAYRWFCRLGLDGEVPEHSTFSKNRHGRFPRLRSAAQAVRDRGPTLFVSEGLVDGTAFAVDASLIAADADKQRSAAGSDDVDWEAIAGARRSVRELLDTLDGAPRRSRHRQDQEPM